MEKEEAIYVIDYLIAYSKTHDETNLNCQEIKALNYIVNENKRLETQLKKQKEINQKAIEYINNSCYCPAFNKDYLDNLLSILEDKEV